MIVDKQRVNESSRDYVIRVLRENIISLNLKPGSNISVYSLEKILNVSRTPIREALIDLGKTGIIEVYPQKGSKVSYIDFNRVDEARFLRLAIEKSILEIVVDKIDDEGFNKLDLNLKMQEEVLKFNDSEKMMKLDNEFHFIFFEIANMENLFYIKDSLYIHFDRVRSLRLISIDDNKMFIEHNQIVDALKKRDKNLVKEAIEKHLSGYTEKEKNIILEKYPDYFKSM